MNMKIFAATLTAAMLPSLTIAEDSLMEGGRSPDGHYEVRLARTPNYDIVNDSSEYSFQIHAKNKEKPLFTLPGSGFRDYSVAKGYCKALWSQTSRFAVIAERDTRHTTEIYIMDVSSDGAKRLEIPDYVQNALGRVNATSIDFACVSTPKRWDGDDLIVGLYFTANGRHSYTCDVTLHLYHEQDSESSVGLKSVSKPKEDEA